MAQYSKGRADKNKFESSNSTKFMDGLKNGQDIEIHIYSEGNDLSRGLYCFIPKRPKYTCKVEAINERWPYGLLQGLAGSHHKYTLYEASPTEGSLINDPRFEDTVVNCETEAIFRIKAFEKSLEGKNIKISIIPHSYFSRDEGSQSPFDEGYSPYNLVQRGLFSNLPCKNIPSYLVGNGTRKAINTPELYSLAQI